MANLNELENQIRSANELGRMNLKKAGVKVSEAATTYEIMTAIAEISGGGVIYESIVYNDDNTITLTDKDGNEHTMECEYTDGKLTSVKYDEREIILTYDGDLLDYVGETKVNLINAPLSTKGSGDSSLDHTVKFMADGGPYEIIQVTDGCSVNAPSVNPESADSVFAYWQIDDEKVEFPFLPETDTVITALFVESYASTLYAHFNVDKTIYPYLIVFNSVGDRGTVEIMFAQSITYETNGVILKNWICTRQAVTDLTDIEALVNEITNKHSGKFTSLTPADSVAIGFSDTCYYYGNFDFTGTAKQFERIY